MLNICSQLSLLHRLAAAAAMQPHKSEAAAQTPLAAQRIKASAEAHQQHISFFFLSTHKNLNPYSSLSAIFYFKIIFFFAHLSETLKITICLNLISFGFSQLFHRISIIFLFHICRESESAWENAASFPFIFVNIFFAILSLHSFYGRRLSLKVEKGETHTHTQRGERRTTERRRQRQLLYLFYNKRKNIWIN